MPRDAPMLAGVPASLEVPGDALGLDPSQFNHYLNARQRGEGHNMAMIVATKNPPGAGRRDERWRLANNGRGKYQTGLADYPGDPRAFVHSMHDARKVAEKKGMQILDEPVNARTGWQHRENEW